MEAALNQAGNELERPLLNCGVDTSGSLSMVPVLKDLAAARQQLLSVPVPGIRRSIDRTGTLLKGGRRETRDPSLMEGRDPAKSIWGRVRVGALLDSHSRSDLASESGVSTSPNANSAGNVASRGAGWKSLLANLNMGAHSNRASRPDGSQAAEVRIEMGAGSTAVGDGSISEESGEHGAMGTQRRMQIISTAI